MTQFSQLGERFAAGSGILELMEDLGEALASGDDLCMLGGGNPAQVPGVTAALHQLGRTLLADSDRWARCLGDYSGPRGEPRFLEALAEQFRLRYGWQVTAENLVLTAGSQASFFGLFNLLGGCTRDRQHRPVMLPRLPEYVGYAGLGLDAEDLIGVEARPVRSADPCRFDYRIDWDALRALPKPAALCVSTPGNPTGQQLTAAELRALHGFASQSDACLIVDAAYGLPFPGIVYAEDLMPFWMGDSVLCLSLSKLGLPGVRTGIVVAPVDLARALTAFNASLNLAPMNLGPYLLYDWVVSGELFEVGQRCLQPFYRTRCELALSALDHALGALGINYAVHTPGGGFFLWLWLPGLGIAARELYGRLKAAGVLVVPGEHFCPGLVGGGLHAAECLRLSYAGPPERFALGMQRLAEVLSQTVHTRRTRPVEVTT